MLLRLLSPCRPRLDVALVLAGSLLLGSVLPTGGLPGGPRSAAAQSGPAHFTSCVAIPTNAVVVLDSTMSTDVSGFSGLEAGDEVAAFTDDGTCAGAAVWGSDGASLTVAGPNAGDPENSGYSAGDPLQYRLWDASADRSYHIGADATYDCSGISDNLAPLCTESGTYQTDVVYRVTRLQGGALPVELARFQAARAGSGARLEWTTASETNNAGFNVQHRGPGASSWTRLGFVEGRGTRSEPARYAFTTEALETGTHRFRLRQVDTDGTATLSREVRLEMTLRKAYAITSARPNPVTTTARMTLTVRTAQKVVAEVYNARGQRVATLLDRSVAAGQPVSIRVNGRSLASGAYFVRVRGEAFSTVERVTVVR
jgi:hypothetical protein